MTKTPYEFFARFNSDGTVAGCTVRYQIWADGVLIKDGDPEPVNVNDAAFAAFASAFSAAAISDRELLQTELTELQADYDAKVNDNEAKHFQIQTLTEKVEALTAERDARPTHEQLDVANAQVAQLQARIDELTSQPVQPVATMGQVRKWLILHYGPAIIQQVNQLIEAIPDKIQRAAAMSDWEYANIMLRSNPLVEQMGEALGMTLEELDAAYLESSQLP